jgi:putative transposase
VEEGNVVGLPRPGGTVEDDPLLYVLRKGARQRLMHAIEAEVAAFLAAHDHLADDTGRRRLVRNGHAPQRSIQTGIGPIGVRRPRVRDRGARDAPRIRFTSAVLPAYLRRARNVEALLPWLYLKGISTGQFGEALTALLGPDAPGLSPAPRSVAWSAPGKRSIGAGRAVICRPSGMSTSGPMGSTSRRAANTTASACWC